MPARPALDKIWNDRLATVTLPPLVKLPVELEVINFDQDTILPSYTSLLAGQSIFRHLHRKELSFPK